MSTTSDLAAVPTPIAEGDIVDLRNRKQSPARSGSGLKMTIILVIAILGIGSFAVDAQRLPDGSRDVAIRNPFSSLNTSFGKGYYLFNLKGWRITR